MNMYIPENGIQSIKVSVKENIRFAILNEITKLARCLVELLPDTLNLILL